MMVTGLSLAWIMRLSWAAAPGRWTERWQRSLIAFLFPPLLLVMTAIAGISAVNRTQRRFAGIYWHSLLSVLASSTLVTGFAMVGIQRID